MVFLFGKHELTPNIEELVLFRLKHCYHTDVIFSTHKSNYFKDFQSTFNVLKNFLPKETSGDYLYCPFDLLLDRGQKKVGDFLDLAKFRAFTLIVLGQLLLSHSQYHINGVLYGILEQLSKGKTLVPMIIVEIISSLSHCACHCKGRLYSCPAFLQAWLCGHISSLCSSIPRQVTFVPTPSRKKAMIDYQRLLANLPTEHIIWRAKWHKAHCLYLFSKNRTCIILIGLY